MTARPLLILAVAVTAAAEPEAVLSPGGNVKLMFDMKTGRPSYSVQYKGKEVMRESLLGLVLEGAPRLDSNLRIANINRRPIRESWEPVYGERSTIPDQANVMDISLEELIPPRRRLAIEFRAYDEGVAFRYRLPEQPQLTGVVIGSEATEFRLPEGAFGWETPIAQALYRRVKIEEMKQPSERPFLLELPSGLWVAIAEAGVEDFSSMFVAPLRGDPHSLAAKLMGPVSCRVPFASPWRVLLIGEQPGELLEHNYLLMNLSPPSRLQQTNWIKPGKVLREVTLSTKGGREAVDFAVRHGIQYIEYDAGWYGHEYDEESDATHVSVDPRRLRREPEYQDLDLAAVIQYAKSKGIGVWLYVNRRAMERQLDVFLPLFRQWGVSGVKYGFVNVHTQAWTRWLYQAVSKAATQNLMLDVHDEFRPTGMSRTYPNLLTQEGILGNEAMPDSTHSTILPFTRMLAGAGDYTFCWNDQRLKNTWGHQLAMSVVIYSPLQFVYWYDRPAQFSDESPGMEFFAHVPTTWDETKVLAGAPGKYAVIARRRGKEWYIGAITNEEPRAISVVVSSILNPEQKYTANVYQDGEGPKDIRKTVRECGRGDVMEFRVAPYGGVALRIVPSP